MPGKTQTRTAGRQMRRLIALLLALAGLAERAAGRSAPVRHLVLWLLTKGEAAAGDYVFALTGRAACWSAAMASRQPDAATAMRLAARFRALAAALSAYSAAVAASQAELRHALDCLDAMVAGAAAPACPSVPVERRDSS